MDIDRLTPIPDTRPAASDVSDLLGRLRAAGSVEAEVIRVLKDQLLLRSELGEILARNRLDLRPGDRVRIRLAGNPSAPVLRVSPAPPKPISVTDDAVPRLARALPADRPVLAEILRVLPAATEIRWAGRTHSLPLRIESADRSLLSLERRPATATIVLTPLARAPIYRALLRHLLPRQTADDADSLVRLVERMRPRPEAPARVAQSSPLARESAPVPRPPATLATVPQSLRARPESYSPRATVITASGRRPAAPAAASIASTAAQALPRSPRLATAQGTAIAGAARGDDSSITVRGAASDAPTRASVMFAPIRQASVPAPAPGQVRATPRPAPIEIANPSRAAIEAPAVMRAVQPPPGVTTDAKPHPEPVSVPQAGRFEWLPRSVELDAPRLRHWIELLGFARPTTAAAARMPDLVDWLRQLLSNDPPLHPPTTARGRRAAARGGGEPSSAVTDDRGAAVAAARESFRLAEQALTHNLLQRAAAGLQQETQQPLNLSLTLPFVDGAEVRPLRLELEQRGRRGEAGGDPSWEVRVSFEFGALGPITCHLVLAGSALAASFYCEREATRDAVASALPDLRRQLDAAGFDAGELHSFVGRARAPQAVAATATDCLIDLEA